MLWFALYGFYYFEICFFYASFLESFYHKWVLNFVKGFLCICRNSHIVFVFQFVNMVCHIDLFAYIEEFLYPWDEAHLIMIYDLFSMLLNSLC